ncbi:MAG: hypothetical protein LC642_01900 [Verrucomicrobiaceae bacterium]|nr:hypothetical protein [Verrucomicrobiaceae bacterium]
MLFCAALKTTHLRIPTSTYGLQFNRTFTFKQAREIVPYLHELGISDCYASPYFQARAESLHGYDITDHNKLNAAIGSRSECDAWVAEVQARDWAGARPRVAGHRSAGADVAAESFRRGAMLQSSRSHRGERRR